MPSYRFDVDGKTYKCHAEKPLMAVKKVVAQQCGVNHRFYICRKELYSPSGKSIANRYLFITININNLKKWLSDQFKVFEKEKAEKGWDQWNDNGIYLTQKDIIENALTTYNESCVSVASDEDTPYHKRIYNLRVKAYSSDLF